MRFLSLLCLLLTIFVLKAQTSTSIIITIEGVSARSPQQLMLATYDDLFNRNLQHPFFIPLNENRGYIKIPSTISPIQSIEISDSNNHALKVFIKSGVENKINLEIVNDTLRKKRIKLNTETPFSIYWKFIVLQSSFQKKFSIKKDLALFTSYKEEALSLIKNNYFERDLYYSLLRSERYATSQAGSKKEKKQFKNLLEKELVNGIDLYQSSNYMNLLETYTSMEVTNSYHFFNDPDLWIKEKKLERRVFKRTYKNDTLEDFARLFKLKRVDDSYSWEIILSLANKLLVESHHPATKQLIKNYIRQHIINKRLTKGQKAPNFTLPDTSLQQIQLSQFRGKYVLLDFWTTWCKPCIKSMKGFNALKEKYGNNLEIISISGDFQMKKMKEFMDKHSYNWVFLFGGMQGEVLKTYNVKSFPTYYLIDPEGNFVNNGKIYLNAIGEYIK